MDPTIPGRPIVRMVLVALVVVAIPLATTFAWGEIGGHWLQSWRNSPPAPELLAAILAGLLAADVLLPVPSGPLITLAGAHLGLLPTVLAATAGMTLGGIIAFAIGRYGGSTVVQRFTTQSELDRVQSFLSGHFAWLLLVTRPLPMLAEVAVLFAGLAGCGWRVLLVNLVPSSAVVALVFALLGDTAGEREWLVVAVALSVVVPLALSALVLRSIGRR